MLFPPTSVGVAMLGLLINANAPVLLLMVNFAASAPPDMV